MIVFIYYISYIKNKNKNVTARKKHKIQSLSCIYQAYLWDWRSSGAFIMPVKWCSLIWYHERGKMFTAAKKHKIQSLACVYIRLVYDQRMFLTFHQTCINNVSDVSEKNCLAAGRQQSCLPITDIEHEQRS